MYNVHIHPVAKPHSLSLVVPYQYVYVCLPPLPPQPTHRHALSGTHMYNVHIHPVAKPHSLSPVVPYQYVYVCLPLPPQPTHSRVHVHTMYTNVHIHCSKTTFIYSQSLPTYVHAHMNYTHRKTYRISLVRRYYFWAVFFSFKTHRHGRQAG